MSRLNTTNNLNQGLVQQGNNLTNPNIFIVYAEANVSKALIFNEAKAIAFHGFPLTEIKYSFDNTNWMTLPENSQYWINGLNNWSGTIYVNALNNTEIQVETWK